MRVCVLSDTHGELRPLLRMREQLGTVDALFHLGDHCRDAREAAAYLGCPVYLVKGNCDRHEPEEEEELCFTLKGKRFLLMHGHKCGSEGAMFYKGLEKHADAVLFGHTHVPYAAEREGILLLNPGSLSEPRYMSAPGCAVLEWEEGGPLTYRFIVYEA